MTAKFCIGLVVLTALASPVSGQAPPQPPEPVYQGKPLSEWLMKACATNATPEVRQRADEALREAGTNATPSLERMLREQDGYLQPPDEPICEGKPLSTWFLEFSRALEPMNGLKGSPELAEESVIVSPSANPIGTNAIPTLLRLLRARDSAEKVRMMELLQNQKLVKVGYVPAARWNFAGAGGFLLLGTNAQPAVPALIEIAEQDISTSSKTYAITALAFIGPSARDAVPLLLREATNADFKLRFTASGDVAPLKLRYTARSSLLRIDPEAAAKAGITNSP